MTDSNTGVDINLRASGYFIAETTAVCRRCSRQTKVYAVVLPAGHEVLELDDELGGEDELVEEDTTAVDTWQVAIHPALLFHVAYLSVNAQRRLAVTSRIYASDDTESKAEERCWANRCDHCGVQIDDQELFSEPGDAFVPGSDADARRIHLVAIDESIEVLAGGYAYRPEFFDAMSRD